MTRSWLQVGTALQNIQTIVKTLAYKKNIDLEMDVSADLPAIFADEAKLKQILYNLLSNAIKFTGEGGRVTVTATPCREGPEPFLQIAVADTGIGIRPEDQQRIFNEFEQVDLLMAGNNRGRAWVWP